jgi:hypothetical protein
MVVIKLLSGSVSYLNTTLIQPVAVIVDLFSFIVLDIFSI